MVFFLSILAISVAALLFVQWLDVEAVNLPAQRKVVKPIKALGKPSYVEAPAQAQRA